MSSLHEGGRADATSSYPASEERGSTPVPRTASLELVAGASNGPPVEDPVTAILFNRPEVSDRADASMDAPPTSNGADQRRSNGTGAGRNAATDAAVLNKGMDAMDELIARNNSPGVNQPSYGTVPNSAEDSPPYKYEPLGPRKLSAAKLDNLPAPERARGAIPSRLAGGDQQPSNGSGSAAGARRAGAAAAGEEKPDSKTTDGANATGPPQLAEGLEAYQLVPLSQVGGHGGEKCPFCDSEVNKTNGLKIHLGKHCPSVPKAYKRGGGPKLIPTGMFIVKRADGSPATPTEEEAKGDVDDNDTNSSTGSGHAAADAAEQAEEQPRRGRRAAAALPPAPEASRPKRAKQAAAPAQIAEGRPRRVSRPPARSLTPPRRGAAGAAAAVAAVAAVAAPPSRPQRRSLPGAKPKAPEAARASKRIVHIARLDGQFQCGGCGRLFETSAGLKRHAHVHKENPLDKPEEAYEIVEEVAEKPPSAAKKPPSAAKKPPSAAKKPPSAAKTPSPRARAARAVEVAAGAARA